MSQGSDSSFDRRISSIFNPLNIDIGPLNTKYAGPYVITRIVKVEWQWWWTKKKKKKHTGGKVKKHIWPISLGKSHRDSDCLLRGVLAPQKPYCFIMVGETKTEVENIKTLHIPCGPETKPRVILAGRQGQHDPLHHRTEVKSNACKSQHPPLTVWCMKTPSSLSNVIK